MRDPLGRVTLEQDRVVRHLHHVLDEGHFLKSELARRCVDAQQLVAFEFLDERTVVSPRVPMVSYPDEWCDSQLHDAASLTLDLAERVIEEGYELKDASAWNIIFQGTRPVFCDHLSLTRAETKAWWAAGQFSRHFVVPLWLSRRRDFRSSLAFRTWRDGVPPAQARALMGASRFMSRYWPLVAEGASRAPSGVARAAPAEAAIQSYRTRLHASMRWMLSGVKPRQVASPDSNWREYANERPQYPGESLARKRELVQSWLSALRPEWVADLGCNMGEFSRMAMDSGALVVAVDGDHACINALYNAHRNESRLFPMLMPLDDLTGGRGWAGSEYAGIAERFERRFDVVMALALTHHLMVSSSIAITNVARLLARWTRRSLIVECIHPEDFQLQLLCAQRRRDPAEFSLAQQIQAFESAGLQVEQKVDLAPAARTLLLLRKAV